MDHVEVTSYGNDSGPNPCPEGGRTNGFECTNIKGWNASDVSLSNIRVEGGSSGIQCASCPDIHIQYFEGINMRGPFPRGQCVQVSYADNAILEDFSCTSDITSWTEDNISMWRSSNAIVRRGTVDGSNTINGVGVMFEGSTAEIVGGLIEDVDVIGARNGCFSAYGGNGVTFRNTLCADQPC